MSLYKKRKSYDAKDISLSSDIFFAISNGENVRKWVTNLVLKYHDDPTVNKSEIVGLLKQIWVYAGNREGFEGKKSKRDWEEGKA